jgi:hypothetical protein
MARSVRKWLLWALAGTGLFGLVLVLVAVWLLQPDSLKARAEATLARELKLDVSIGSLHVAFLPRPRVEGTGLVFRVPGQSELPPFVSVDHFWMDVGLFSALRKHIDTVHLGGMKVFVPPGDAKKALPHATSPSGSTGKPGGSRVVLNHLETHDAELTILRKKATDTPLVFKIHALEMDGLGFDREMDFTASLTNPIPEGEIDTKGTIGPWPGADVWNLPVRGQYTLTDANLGTISGVQGTLTSDGRYQGWLTQITVNGKSTTPDFNLDLGGKPVPLTATFTCVVDASDGTTTLQPVDAKLFNTPIHAEGVIANLPGPGNHLIDLKVTIADGRIEDVLRLVVDSPKPTLTGDVNIRTTVKIPPGKARVRQRIALNGQFGLDAARFTDAQVQDKLHELSRRSQGKDEGEAMARVLTSLSGSFELERGMLTLRRLSFHVPGARVDLNGTYALDDGALNLEGTLQMQATVSQAVGGFKSIFIKPFDAIFKHDGAGAVVPIKITGTRDSPKFGVQMGKAIKKK